MGCAIEILETMHHKSIKRLFEKIEMRQVLLSVSMTKNLSSFDAQCLGNLQKKQL